jgi:hypothetical protein
MWRNAWGGRGQFRADGRGTGRRAWRAKVDPATGARKLYVTEQGLAASSLPAALAAQERLLAPLDADERIAHSFACAHH